MMNRHGDWVRRVQWARHALACAAAGAVLILAAGCASDQPTGRPSDPNGFSFGVIGDLQYDAREEALFPQLIDAMNRESLAFVVHLGDFKAGSNAPCTNELFDRRATEFARSAHPFILLTGDNDWVDCRRPTNGRMDPLERLERLRHVFYREPRSLGQRTLPLTRPSDVLTGEPAASRYVENAFWVHRSVVFASFNIQGSNDNVGFDAVNDAEQRERERINIALLKHAAARARASDIVGLVVTLQANPGFEETPDKVAKSAYMPFLRAFESEAAALGKPILFTHGDTHQFRIDRPYRSPLDGRPVANAIRLEGYGSPNVDWVRVTVDTRNRQEPFFIESGGFVPARAR